MKKVLMFVQNSFRRDERVRKEAASLARNGYDVLVIAIHEDELDEVEYIDGFKLIRVRLLSKKIGRNIFAKIIKYLELLYRSMKYGLDFNPVIIHCHDIYPIITVFFLRLFLRNNVKVIYDSHEWWKESKEMEKYPKVIRKMLLFLEKRMMTYSDANITVGENIANELKLQNNLDKGPLIIRNIPEYSNLKYDSESVLAPVWKKKPNEKVIMYHGTLSTLSNIDLIIDMANISRDRYVYIVIGEGPLKENYMKKVNSLNLKERVIFIDYLPFKTLMTYIQTADIGLIALAAESLSVYNALPNKLFEYIQNEVPIVSNSFPEIKNIIEKYNIGISVEDENPEEFLKVLDFIFNSNNMYEEYIKNLKKIKIKLNWENEEVKLLDLYDQLLI